MAFIAWLNIPLGEAYLATTPGGIYAALAVANSTGSGPVVTTMQVVRLVAMLITAIVAAKVLTRRRSRAAPNGSRIQASAPLIGSSAER